MSGDLVICTCDAPNGARLSAHRTACAVFERLQTRTRALAEEVTARREAKAAGLRSFRSVHAALAWFYRTREAWGSAKGLALHKLDEGGDGTPNRGADDPKRRTFATVAVAIRDACLLDDVSDVPAEAWLLAHHYVGRPIWALAEEAHRSQRTAERRMAALHKFLGERLRERGVIDG